MLLKFIVSAIFMLLMFITPFLTLGFLGWLVILAFAGNELATITLVSLIGVCIVSTLVSSYKSPSTNRASFVSYAEGDGSCHRTNSTNRSVDYSTESSSYDWESEKTGQERDLGSFNHSYEANYLVDNDPSWSWVKTEEDLRMIADVSGKDVNEML